VIPGLSRFIVGNAPEAQKLCEHVGDCSELLASVLEFSETLHLIVATPDGVITGCNSAAARSAGCNAVDLCGSRLSEHVRPTEWTDVEARIAFGTRSPNERFSLTFADRSSHQVPLSCAIDSQPSHFTIVGERAANHHHKVDEKLFTLNNELAVLARENARHGKELTVAKAKLQETLDELNHTHWHLRKIAEVLPMCVECGMVKPGEGEWESVAEYLRENSLFLSHGCCPACLSKAQTSLGVHDSS
jgi:hypothetical protein